MTESNFMEKGYGGRVNLARGNDRSRYALKLPFLVSARFKFRRQVFLEESDNIRQILHAEAFLKSFRHQGKAGTVERFEISAKNGFFSILGTQGDAIGRFSR